MTQARVLLQVEDNLRHRLEFEKLIAGISTHFLNLDAADIETGIKHTLERIATFVEADRSYVFLASEDANQADNVYEWCAEGIAPQQQRLQHISGRTFPWFAEKIRQLEVIHVARVADLPPEATAEKAGFESQGIQSLLVVPMVSKGELLGFLGFDAVNAEKTWKEEDSVLLKTVGNVLANALTHKWAEDALRESERRYAGIFNTTTDALLLMDANGKILDANVRACDMYGCDYEALLACNITDLVTPDYQSHLLYQIRNSTQTPAKLSLEAINIRQDGSQFYAEIQGGPYTWRDQHHFLAAIRDISERKEAEAQLRIYHDRLEELVEERTAELIETNSQLLKEIAERKRAETALAAYQTHLESLVEVRTIELKKANDAAEASNRAKSEFLANISHELRTPLNAILGYTQILRQDSTLTDTQRNEIEVMHRSGEHLLTLINDILDLSKIEAQKLELMPTLIKLPEFLKSLTDIARIRAQQKGIRFEALIEPALPSQVSGDATRLRQILLNLLSNAVKFTDQGRVTFCVRTCGFNHENRCGNVTLHFSIQDTGKGIPADQLSEVFHPFYQVKDPFAYIEGTGLGLTISQQLVQKMGGTIEVESTPRQGSHFWFEITMPVLLDTQFSAREAEQDTSCIIGFHGRKRRIVIADDHEANRLLIKNVLSPLGFSILEARTGQETLQTVLASRPDLVLLDLVMPEIDGFEVIRRIRQSPEVKDLVVIAVSAYVFEHTHEKSLAAGCQDFITKPIDISELLRKLQHWLDLEWLYRPGKAPQAPEVCSDLQPFAIPSLEEVHTLLSIAQQGHLKKLIMNLDRLERLDVQWQPLTRQVRQFATRFQMDQICQFLEKIVGKG